MRQTFAEAQKDIVAIGRLVWEKNLSGGLSGNVSARVNEDQFAVTATETCLGLLHEDDIVLMDLQGAVLQGEHPSSEWRLHCALYNQVADCNAVVHVHSLYTNAFFLMHDQIDPKILEAKFRLGEVGVVDQATLNVEDCQAVADALARSRVVVLRSHGSLAVGKNLFECFVLLQTLEDAAKTEIVCQMCS